MSRPAWSDAIEGWHPRRGGSRELIVGALHGEGVGPEVVEAAIAVLAAACDGAGIELDVRRGPDPPHRDAGLSEEAADFCRSTFAAGGAVLTGPHGGRWVYELRQRFDLFCKLSPIVPIEGAVPQRFSPAPGSGAVDVLVVREQTGGIYQGRWSDADQRREGRVAEHSFSYSDRQVRRIAEVSARLAGARERRLAVVVKRAGIPSISRLWESVMSEVCERDGVAYEVLDIDYAVYALLRDPAAFDVVVAPNLFGDVLADAGGLILGSRGLCFGASFDDRAAAVYQTNHGAAHDLAGTDRANPGAQILAAAAMLRQSFGRDEPARRIEDALAATLASGIRTEDLAEGASRVVGTRELTTRVADELRAGALAR